MFQDRPRLKEKAESRRPDREAEPTKAEEAEIEGVERGTSARIAGDFKSDPSRRRQEERRQLQAERNRHSVRGFYFSVTQW